MEIKIEIYCNEQIHMYKIGAKKYLTKKTIHNA